MIIDIETAAKEAEILRKKEMKIVTTNGVFDILHIGHVRYLAAAKKLGDVLFVGINSDASTKMNKGVGRPIIPEQERSEMLDALKPVDYVFIFEDKTPNRWIELIKPDIHVKGTGQDYKIEDCVEKGSVEKHNGKVVLISKTDAKSTTNIIEKIRSS